MLDNQLSASQLQSAEWSVAEEHTEQSQSQCTGDEDRAQGQKSQDGGMIRVVISRQQLAKLLAEGSIKKALLPPSAMQSNGNCDMALLISKAMTMTRNPGSPWCPRLDTIVEAPVQLTRSPVITRNCQEVQHLLQTKM